MTEIQKEKIHEMHNHDPHGDITEKSSLNDNLFARELDYQVSLSMAECLLKSGFLTGAEFYRAKALFLERFCPPIGTLLAEAG